MSGLLSDSNQRTASIAITATAVLNTNTLQVYDPSLTDVGGTRQRRTIGVFLRIGG